MSQETKGSWSQLGGTAGTSWLGIALKPNERTGSLNGENDGGGGSGGGEILALSQSVEGDNHGSNVVDLAGEVCNRGDEVDWLDGTEGLGFAIVGCSIGNEALDALIGNKHLGEFRRAFQEWIGGLDIGGELGHSMSISSSSSVKVRGIAMGRECEENSTGKSGKSSAESEVDVDTKKSRSEEEVRGGERGMPQVVSRREKEGGERGLPRECT